MSWESVKEYLTAYGAQDRMISFSVSSATVNLAAQALGVIPARIAKSLTFRLGDGCAVIVFAGDARVDNSAFKARFHEKAAMLPHEEVEALTGHPVGGVCPFALNEGVPVYLDESLLRFKTVFPAAGTASSAVELTPQELFRISRAREWVRVSKGWQEIGA